ncbi:MAG: IS4 family transposase [Chloroflexi bacterium]|nr:MAG: IS4 family transposase [Chloroflexota bacterium]
MALDDKISRQVSVEVFTQIYPPQTIETLVEQDAHIQKKERRVRHFVRVSVVWFVLMMAIWTRLAQARVWDKLTHKLLVLHPDEDLRLPGASALSSQRQLLGDELLRRLMEQCCHPLCSPQTPGAFYKGYRLMALDGTLFNVPDTPANDAAFGRSRNQYGKGAYPQIRCVSLLECGSHATIAMSLSPYTRQETHGAHDLLGWVQAGMLVMHDARLFGGGLWQGLRTRGAQVLSAIAEPILLGTGEREALSDGSDLTWLQPSKGAVYPLKKPMRIRVIEYRVTDKRLGELGKVSRLATTLLDEHASPALELIVQDHERWELELVYDEIKTHQRQQQKVLRSKTPQGVRQEVDATMLAHYAVRAVMLQAAEEAGLDPDRLSFTEAVFQISEAIDDAMVLAPEHGERLTQRLRRCLRHKLLPERHLRMNRREVKQVYNKHKPKKRRVPPPEPFQAHERFEDFVVLEVRYPLPTSKQEVLLALN